MHWESFYVCKEFMDGDSIRFPSDEVGHLSRVLRKKVGDTVWTVDGEGTAYRVQLTRIKGNEAEGKVIQTRKRLGEPVAEVTLAQAVLKGTRFDWLVEKATELGVHRIIPMTTERTASQASRQKLARWKRVAIAAMKQSGRCILPDITQGRPLEYVCSLGAGCRFRLIAEAASDSHPFHVQDRPPRSSSTARAILLVGPEGGFTEREINLAKEHGYTSVSLGPRRLRSETAGFLLTALVLSQLGELE